MTYKGTELTGRLRRLICVFVVRIQQCQVLSHQCSFKVRLLKLPCEAVTLTQWPEECKLMSYRLQNINQQCLNLVNWKIIKIWSTRIITYISTNLFEANTSKILTNVCTISPYLDHCPNSHNKSTMGIFMGYKGKLTPQQICKLNEHLEGYWWVN